ncbi:MAG: hypothetical protein ACTSR8_09380 [Promethearchaeota archaeon]
MRKIRFNLNVLLGVWLISIILVSVSASVLAAQNTYQINIKRGSQTYTVASYDKDAWEKSIGKSISPDDWFKGDADKVNSQSRITIRSISEVKYDTSDLWLLLFSEDMSKEASGIFITSSDDINKEYDGSYKAWEILYGKWDFTTDSFEEDADEANAYFVILKNPEDYSEILANYNEWVATMNIALEMNPDTQGISFSNYTTEEFFWMLVMDQLVVVADPIEDYLNAIVDKLDIKDVEANDYTLTIEKSDYTIAIEYGSNGIQNSIEISDKNGDIIYEISQDISNLIWLIVIPILIIMGITSIIYKFSQNYIKTEKKKKKLKNQ